MADDIQVDAGSGPAVATDEVSSRHYQLIKPAYGADGSATLVSAGAGLPTQSAYTELTGSASANNTDVVSGDVSGYRSLSVQITGTFNANVQFQCSNDNTNWVAFYVTVASTINQPAATVASTGLYFGSVPARYFRLRTTAYTSGTVSAVVGFSSHPPHHLWQYLSGAGATLTVSGSSLGVTGGASASGDGASATSNFAAPGLVYNGSTWDRRRSLGVTGIAGVTPTPGTTGGWSVASYTAMDNTKQATKASAGTLGGWMVHNPSAAAAYVQVFNVASASVTVGTTAPTYVIPVAAGQTENVELTCGINHSTAITVAATTTPTGGTSPATPLVAAILYK